MVNAMKKPIFYRILKFAALILLASGLVLCALGERSFDAAIVPTSHPYEPWQIQAISAGLACIILAVISFLYAFSKEGSAVNGSQ